MINTHEMICAKCLKYMKKIQAGVKIRVEDMNGIQACDKWQCGGCHAEVLSGFADEYDFGKKNEDIYIERLRY